ncbi:N-acyl homoserine lactonase family protein [Actinokineospora sp.]|uniref:N-acyl homoserine lactonase family protein n=1 Tax=Actinokineospora sp. TaxID=1872133 RepID=UPI0040378D99
MVQITAVQTGEVQIKSRHVEARFRARPARVADVLADRRWSPRLPILCFVVEHPEGQIVVDTGESSHANDPGYHPWWHPFTRTSERRWVEPEEEVGPQLRALGVEPDGVRWLVMTHMHGDHSGGLEHFPNAEVVLSAKEAAMAFGRTGPVNGYFNSHYPAALKPRVVRFDSDPWEVFDATVPLTRDGTVRLVPTPGHTQGHMSVVVEQSDHLVLLTGDAAYSERALLAGVVDGVAQSARRHRGTTAKLIELCRRRRVVVVPSHDPEGKARLTQSTFTNPDARSAR